MIYIYDDDDDKFWECRQGTAENRAVSFLVFVTVDYDIGKFAVMVLNLLANSCPFNLVIVNCGPIIKFTSPYEPHGSLQPLLSVDQSKWSRGWLVPSSD